MTSFQPELHMSYNKDYKLIICIQCRYAVKPHGIYRHFKERHPKIFSTKDKEQLCQYGATFQLEIPESIKQPDRIIAAVSGLKVTNGFKCNICEYFCIGNSSIVNHCRSLHNWGTAKMRIWKSCLLQSFFAGTISNYMLLIVRNAFKLL